ncbi:MAG: EB domain-containing protein [Bacteroidia bacterium]
MKKTLSLLFVLVGLTSLNSCQKDDPGAGSPCENIVCLNGGYCANGQCVCPEGYTGANCSQQITPDIIRINKIEVTQFPPTDAGAGWDLTSGADIFPIVYLGSTELWNSATFFQNADPNSVYSFIPNPAIELKSPTSPYIIRLYDYDDLDADDYMGGIQFTPYHSTNKFPPVLTLDAGGGVAFKLYVSYSW